MSHSNNSPTDYAPPPPPYRLSQDEFDQKISQAIESSLSAPAPMRIVDEDGWPIYDETAFEAVASSYRRSSGGSSSAQQHMGQDTWGKQGLDDVKAPVPTANTQPLRIRRRNNSSQKALQDPVARTRLVDSARSGSPRPHHSSLISGDPRASPPPPFTPTGPSLDGPPFDDVVRLSWDGLDSRAASPLASPQPSVTGDLPHVLPRFDRSGPSATSIRHQHLSLPPPSRPINRRGNPRPVTTDYTIPLGHHATASSHLDFDPLSAYGKHQPDHAETPVASSSQQAITFYNHAVASQLPSPYASAEQFDRGRLLNASPYTVPRGASPLPPHGPSRQPDRGQTMSIYHGMPPSDASSANLPPFPRPMSASPGYNQPSSTFDSQSQYSVDTGTIGSRQQWAASEAQLIRDLYQREG
ncbi:hypothetical protein EW146_g4979 [Bondarzewia mesenterica]|uniref:Uncharacterized protein n=1 Tax=Bondarzewia mesenterica TaxID=1095465 RepID=A0A4S4LTW9_9AGAM|nr:hypothetical protein EW146_g4979 [Bondarzewia mesenterica]